MAVTILDVAHHAGVAKSTVSRVLSGRGNTSEKTRQRVFQAIEELGFRPNVLAQTLATHASGMIGLLLPSGSGMSKCMASLVSDIHEMDVLAGQSIIMKQVRDEPGGALNAIYDLIDQRCEAVLYYNPSSFSNYNETIEQLNRCIDSFSVPVILLNSYLPAHPDRCVWYDQESFAAQPVDYLLQHGHKRIAYISGSLGQRTAQQRLQGYQRAVKDAGIPFDPLLFVERQRCPVDDNGNEDQSLSGYLACQQLIERGLDFTAVCCFNDHLAIGAQKALQDAGLSVPDDVSVFGFDNEPILNYFNPRISSVILPSEAFITHAIKLTLAHLNGSELPNYDELDLSVKLVVRESVKSLV